MKIKKLIKKLKAMKKAKKGTRYDWGKIPAVVMWVWQTGEGMLIGSEQTASPILLETHFAALAEMKRVLSDTLVLRPAKNWRKSLEKRPSNPTTEFLARGFEQTQNKRTHPIGYLWEGTTVDDPSIAPTDEQKEKLLKWYTGFDPSNGKDYGASVEIKKDGDTFTVTKVDLFEPTDEQKTYTKQEWQSMVQTLSESNLHGPDISTEKGNREWVAILKGEPTLKAAELDTIAQTHEALNYCQPLPVKPQEESETRINGKVRKAWRTLGGFEIVPDLLANLDYLEQARQKAENKNNQAFSGNPDSNLESFLNYLSQHNGEKLTLIVCHDCHKVAIDTPSQMRKNNPFVFVHGWGWHCSECALEVGLS